MKKIVPHVKKTFSCGCVDAVFHRNISPAGGTDQMILPATLG
jgi:hypothetical protein